MVDAGSDNKGLPIRFILTSGDAADYVTVGDLMALPLPKPKALLADNGYYSDRFREKLLMRGMLPIIPPLPNRQNADHPDYRRHKDRNLMSKCSIN